MALEGNLTDFGLSEILQLIGVQQKSGMLSINSDDRSMVLFFRDGKLISTRDRRRKSKDPFKDYLTRYGVISRQDLLRIMQISAQSKLDITDIIVSEKFLTEEEMKKHFRYHIQEAVHEILTWQQCNYKFMPGRDIIDGIKTWGEYSIEGLLMESMRRIDEFPQILEEFPDEKMIISRKKTEEEPQDLEGNEEKILSLLKEERTLGYLIAHAEMPSFDTYEALKHLKEKGLIATFLELRPETAAESAGKSKRLSAAGILARVSSVVILFALVVLAGWIGVARTIPSVKSGSITTSALMQADPAAKKRMAARVRWFLEAYRAEHGAYPRSLDDLERSGLSPASFLEKVKSFGFKYYLTPSENTYTLL
jgi:hypothetical protein